MKNLEQYPFLKKIVESNFQNLKRKNHPLLTCIEKNSHIIAEINQSLQYLEGREDVLPLIKDLLSRSEIESFKDSIVELTFAGYLSSKNRDFRIVPKDKKHGTPDFSVLINSTVITIELKRIADPFSTLPVYRGEVRIIDDIRKLHSRIDDSLGRRQFYDDTPHIILIEAYAGLGEDEVVDLLYQEKGHFEVHAENQATLHYMFFVPYSGIFLDSDIQDETKYDQISGIVVHFSSTSIGKNVETGEIRVIKPRYVFYPNPFAKHPISEDIVKNLGFDIFNFNKKSNH